MAVDFSLQLYRHLLRWIRDSGAVHFSDNADAVSLPSPPGPVEAGTDSSTVPYSDRRTGRTGLFPVVSIWRNPTAALCRSRCHFGDRARGWSVMVAIRYPVAAP